MSNIAFISAGDHGLFLSSAAANGFSAAAGLSSDEMSCSSRSKICSVSFAAPFSGGLLVVDLHRLDRFEVSLGDFIQNSGRTVNVGSLVASYGQASVPTYLKYPSSLSIYEPFNATYIASGSDPVFGTRYEVLTPVEGGKFAFLADTGNDRVCAFNITGLRQLDMMTCISITGPLFVAIMFGPSWEPGVSAANLFVTTSSRSIVKLDFSSQDASLTISGQLDDLPCPGKGIDILNGANIVVIFKCYDNITSGLVALSIDIYNTSRMYIAEIFLAPSNVFLHGPILVTAADITGQKSIITTGGYLDSLSTSSLFITLTLPRSVTVRDRPSKALNFVKTCFNVTSPSGPPRSLIEEACDAFNVSTSVIDMLFANPSYFNYDLLEEIFFVPYRRVMLTCPSYTNKTTGNENTGNPLLSNSYTDSIPISTNGCLVILIITAFVL